METTIASALATHAHRDQTDRFGGPLVDHVARVASAVPPDARSVAWLHDVLERTGTDIEALRSDGLTPVEEAALDVLTRREGEPYEMYTLRVTYAPGDGGRLARTVKRADLDDHIATTHGAVDTPPYGWARQHIANAQWRNHETVAQPLIGLPDHQTLPVASGL